jgi:hypothetical protein
MSEGEIPEQDPWGAPKVTKAVRLLHEQYASDFDTWRNMWQAMCKNAEIIDKHSQVLKKMEFAGDLLHMEVAEVASQQQVMQQEAADVVVSCSGLHEGCVRLTRELQARDKQIEDAVTRCHVMASANTAAVHELASALAEVAANQGAAGGVNLKEFVHAEVSDFVQLSHMNTNDLDQKMETTLAGMSLEVEGALKRGDLAMAAAVNAGRSQGAPSRTPPHETQPAQASPPPMPQAQRSAADAGLTKKQPGHALICDYQPSPEAVPTETTPAQHGG